MAWVRCCGGKTDKRKFIINGTNIEYPYSTADSSLSVSTDRVIWAVTGGNNSLIINGVDLTNYSTLKIKIRKETNPTLNAFALMKIGSTNVGAWINVSETAVTYTFNISSYTGIQSLTFGGNAGQFGIYELYLEP